MNSVIHLNNAAVGQLRPMAARSMIDALGRLSKVGFYPADYKELQQRVESTRSIVARLFGGVSEETIAFTESTSDGFAKLISAMDLQPGDTVALGKASFVSMKAGLKVMYDRGVRLVSIGSDNGEMRVADIANARLDKLRLVIADWVNYKTGVRNPVREIGEFCKHLNLPLILDAVQGLGAAQIDFNLDTLAAIVCGGHKWLCGPEGTGFLYISDWFLSRLHPIHLGYRSLRLGTQWDVPFLELIQGARVFEVGTMNTVGIIGLGEAIEELLSQGYELWVSMIHAHVAELYSILSDWPNLEIVTPRHENRRAGILSFRHCAVSSSAVAETLFRHGLVCAERDGWVRLSPGPHVNITAVRERLTSALADINSQDFLSKKFKRTNEMIQNYELQY